MKFGLFYEHQLPQPWDEDSELRLYQQALDQVELADGSASTMSGKSSTISWKSIRTPLRPRCFSPPARSGQSRSVSATASR